MMEPDVRRRWTKAAPTLPLVSEPSVSTVPPVFEPSEKRRISSSEGGGEDQVLVEIRFSGNEGTEWAGETGTVEHQEGVETMASGTGLGCRYGGGASPGAVGRGVPFVSHQVGDRMAACKGVAPWTALGS